MKLFKIIEKIVRIIAILAIVAVMVLISIGVFANFDKVQIDWSSYISYFYGAAAVVVLYKMAVLYFTSNYQTEIEIKTGMLVSLVNVQKEEHTIFQNENAQNQKLCNAELKQFVTNRIRYNQKENLDAKSFLQTVLENGLVERKRI